jgi:hypothetical protein
VHPTSLEQTSQNFFSCQEKILCMQNNSSQRSHTSAPNHDNSFAGRLNLLFHAALFRHYASIQFGDEEAAEAAAAAEYFPDFYNLTLQHSSITHYDCSTTTHRGCQIINIAIKPFFRSYIPPWMDMVAWCMLHAVTSLDKKKEHTLRISGRSV